MTFGPLVDSQWLADEIGKPDLQILDASAYLPTEPHDAKQLFREAHLPGARFFDIEVFSDPDTSLPHMVPSQGRFARLAGELGLRNDARIVVYDQKGLFSAARAWWLLKLFGHDRVAVLDGGLPKWRDEGRALQSGAVTADATQFDVAFRSALLRGRGDVQRNLDSRAELVLDARPGARFRAEAAEIRPGVEAGHIPHSVNLPYNELLNPDQTFKSAEQLRQRIAALGVDGSQSVVTTCGSGLTAAIISLALAVAGLPIGALYDGSWTEWGSQAELPKARG
ncbi:3-mercaptopyruvate sulfurtransferase [Pseudomonas typographi]|uniref:3-mercaptopyruvate sulfurtransferase n=1 Tax=Pseudomonas typographi TaxID=2715964 RepID=UPI0016865673|nr:3-mercaptopyruvate sulfurtransferase [Pseudomonas typographi]MBD1586872.1 3-mercaptopyruvate sulfurtransferase [Pseudomonas typographi]